MERPHIRIDEPVPAGYATLPVRRAPLPCVRPVAALLICWVLLASGCRDRGLTSYRIPKEPDAAPAPAVEGAAGVPAAGLAAALHWDAPGDWKAQPASGMRQASFLAPGPDGTTADISVVSFPGSGGDDLANINRWRGQLKLDPVSQSDLPSQLQALASPAGPLVLADLTGTGAVRILGAWLRRPDRVWFFKMMGPEGLVGSEKEAFLGFLGSLRITDAGTPAPAVAANTNDLPRTPSAEIPLAAETMPPEPMNSMRVQAAPGASLLWSAPAGWHDKPGSAVRRGSYSLDGGAEVAVTAFPGDVGGVLANVNRWRGQAGLAPVDEPGLASATTALESHGLHLIVCDASTGAAPVVAALVPWNGGTWFFKLTGPAEAVARAKPEFIAFLGTVRAP